MSNHEQIKPDEDVVERAAAALRDVNMPAGPSPELLADTLSAIRSAQMVQSLDNENQNSLRRIFTMKRVIRFSIAAVLTLFVGTAIWTGAPWGGQPAFADVLDKVQRIHSVRFKSIVDQPNSPKPAAGEITMLIVGSRLRQELPGEFVSIMDFKSGEVLSLMNKEKQAMHMRIDNMPKNIKESNVLEYFRNMSANAGKTIGRKEIDGHLLDGYKVAENGKNMTVWTDPKTRLPVRMEAVIDMPMIPKLNIVMKDFEWDVAADESAISMDVPAGYKVQQMTFDGSLPTEKNLIESLRMVATENGGKFAETYDMAGMVAALKKTKAAANAAVADDARRSAIMEKAMTVTRGLMFVQKKNGDDFHYAGKGVELGQAGRPILWYRPNNSEMYHVIDADLTVHTDVKVDELPKIESQKLNAGTFMKTFESPAPASRATPQ